MTEQFRTAIRAAGLEPPDVIEADGKLHRFSSNGKRGDDAGWYVLHGDGIPAGCFGDWRTGVSQSWRADIGRTLSPAEEAAHRVKVEAMRRQREAEDARRKAEAASKAAAIWKAAQPAPDDHPYLTRKAIKAHGARLHDGALVIPMREGSAIHSLQFIQADGGKRFLTGGRVAGCYFAIGDPKGVAALCVAEGFATGATIHETTGYPGAVAFNAGNLEAVARALRARFPDVTLILCADDDVKTGGNSGLTKATAAALAVGGKLAVPDFGADRPDGASDFNDMAAVCGAEAVARAIAAASEIVVPVVDPIEAALNACGLAALESGASFAATEKAVRDLASLLASEDDIRRATVREAALKKLGAIGISAPGRLLDAALQRQQTTQVGSGVMFCAEPEPWPNEVDGAKLLDDITEVFSSYVIMSEHARHSVALWLLHAWALLAFDISALLAIISAMKRSGKTTLLEIINLLAPRALSASNITAAALFRSIESFKPTLLIDEADTFLRDNDELRGVLNAGHRRSSAFVVRTVGDDHEPKQFCTWGAKAIALIGKLPGTLEDRAILIEMRRRAPGEKIARFRSRVVKELCEPLRRQALRWANDAIETLKKLEPEIPEGLNDRAADNWTPLFAIADHCGGEWPKRAREAAKTLSALSDESEDSALVDLLEELKALFQKTDRITSADLAEHLGRQSEKRWADWRHGKPITQRQVARLLAPLKIKPGTIRERDDTAKGYQRNWFDDAFARYLPVSNRHTVTSEEDQEVTAKNDPSQIGVVTDRKSSLSSGKTKNVTVVTDRKEDLWEWIA